MIPDMSTEVTVEGPQQAEMRPGQPRHRSRDLPSLDDSYFPFLEI